MMTRLRPARALLAMAIAATLAACGGEAPDAQGSKALLAQCSPMPGATVSAVVNFANGVCAGCATRDLEKAADGDLSTFATITVPASANGTVSVRATAPAGVVYPAGTLTAAVADISKASSVEYNAVSTLNSYLADAPQEQVSNDERSWALDVNGAGYAKQVLTLPVTQVYDSLEFVYSSSFANGLTLNVYEFCTSATP